jgi:hypothetical protein
MRTGRVGLFAGSVAIVAAVFASSASAATLIGDYQLQGTRASSDGGPALVDIGSGNSFQTDTVMGVQRQVLRFGFDRGLKMAPAGLGDGTGPYSEVVTFRFDDAVLPPDSYARILDFSDSSTDSGLYDNTGYLDYYDLGTDHQSSAQLFADNIYATVAMSVGGGAIRSFFNGSRVVTYEGVNPVIDDTLVFFKDNGATEESAGDVSCIRVYSGALTDAEVGAIGASPTCGTAAAAPVAPTTPATPHKKKCKKHKKKRSAASAKKKKCKRKRKS